jgi:hypothetical protein
LAVGSRSLRSALRAPPAAARSACWPPGHAATRSSSRSLGAGRLLRASALND